MRHEVQMSTPRVTVFLLRQSFWKLVLHFWGTSTKQKKLAAIPNTLQ
jgi:hypothetical protein